MKHFKIIVISALAVSVFMNSRFLYKMSEMEQRITSISHELSSVLKNVENQSSTIYHALEDFKNDQSWIGSFKMDVNRNQKSGEEANLLFEWQIKELNRDAEVNFHYKLGLEQQFTSISATNLGNGRFLAEIPVKVSLKPQWYSSIHRVEESSEEVPIKEEYWRDYQLNDITYYITLEMEDVIKSSSIQEDNISYLENSVYGQIEVFGAIFEGGFDINVSNYYSFDPNSDIKLNEVYLLTYNKDKLVADEQLFSPDSDSSNYFRNFQGNKSNNKVEYTRLVLKVVYSDGKSFEKEIFAK